MLTTINIFTINTCTINTLMTIGQDYKDINNQRYTNKGSFKLSLTLALIPLMFAYSAISYADAVPQVKEVKLNQVTLFLRGAELFSSSHINLPAGESEVVFTNIANNINERSLIIGGNGKAVIQSSSIKKNYLVDQVITPQVEQLKKRLETERYNKDKLSIQIQVLDAKLEVLKSNQKLGDASAAATVENVSKMLELVSVQMGEILLKRADLSQQLKELNKQLQKLERQFIEEQQKNSHSSSQIVVKFYSPTATKSDISLSYAINNAGWLPNYDVRVDDIDQPVKFTYKANVFQNSGINWDNVNLTLSTGNPTESAQVPMLDPWYLDLAQQAKIQVQTESPMSMLSADAIMSAPAPLTERTDSQQQHKVLALDDYVTTNAKGINTSFKISLPYSIPADGKAHLVMIKQTEVKGDYRYLTIPKLEQDAFLQVQITDWQQLNLLPGISQIYYQGSFIGEGYIDVRNVEKNMDISLGRNKNIVVRREADSEMKSKPEYFGSNITQKYSFSIEVKNLPSSAIKLVVIDQLPVSRDNEISVNDVKYSGNAEYNKESGNLQWTLELQPKETKKLTYSYNVKYPKDKYISGL